MIKKLILAILLAIPSMAFAQKFGVVDTDSFLPSMSEVKEMQTTVEATTKKYENELQALNEKFQKDAEAFQAIMNDPETPDAVKERRAQDLQDQRQKMDQFYQNAQNEIQQLQARLMQPIQEKVRQAIAAVGAEGDFTMIFEKMVPLYVGTSAVDVTPLVKQKLNIQ